MAMFVFDVVQPYGDFLRGIPNIFPVLKNICNRICIKIPELKSKLTMLQILDFQQRAERERFKERCLALLDNIRMEIDQVI